MRPLIFYYRPTDLHSFSESQLHRVTTSTIEWYYSSETTDDIGTASPVSFSDAHINLRASYSFTNPPE